MPISVNRVQLSNAYFPIVSSDYGNAMILNLKHYLNALSSIVVTVLGNDIDDRFTHW